MPKAPKPPSFKQGAVTRALRAARSAGMEVGRFDVDPVTGRITVYAKDGTPPPAAAYDAWKARHAG